MFTLTPASTLSGSWIIDNLSMFVISKLLTAITQPMFWLVLWCALALLILKRWRRVSTAMLGAGLLMLGMLGFATVPDAVLRSLESRYPIPNAQGVDKHVGMIVLGGAIERPGVYKAHGQVPLGDAAERMIEPVAIMRNHPKL